MAGNALDVGIALDEVLEYFVLLLVAGLQRDTVLPVTFGMVVFILPQVVGLNTQQNVYIRQALGAVISCLFPGPQLAAEVAVIAGGDAHFLGNFQAVQDKVSTGLVQCGSNAGNMEPGVAFQQGVDIHLAQVVLRDGRVLAVIGDLGGADAVTGFQIVGAQTVGGSFLWGGEDHRSAVNIVGTEHTDSALADGIVGNHGEEGGVDAQIGQSQCNIGFTAAVSCLKFIGHTDFLIVGGSQTEHDLADGDEFVIALEVGEQRVMMFHGLPP